MRHGLAPLRCVSRAEHCLLFADALCCAGYIRNDLSAAAAAFPSAVTRPSIAGLRCPHPPVEDVFDGHSGRGPHEAPGAGDQPRIDCFEVFLLLPRDDPSKTYQAVGVKY
jgi:hypothetical protein